MRIEARRAKTRRAFGRGLVYESGFGEAEHAQRSGRIDDQTLAMLVGTTKDRIRHRRLMFGIPAWTIAQVIEPFGD